MCSIDTHSKYHKTSSNIHLPITALLLLAQLLEILKVWTQPERCIPQSSGMVEGCGKAVDKNVGKRVEKPHRENSM